MRRALLVTGLLVTVACRNVPAGAPPSPGPVVVPAEPKPDPVVDLLHTVDCTVAVSSKVDNPHDFPEHLVDGKAETAWNGRTGDLGGFIAFRVPASARVTRIELTSGFDKVGPKGDLFTMNHRITRVRLSRAGTTISETDLDPQNREPQKIVVPDAPGGDFELRVLATLPGTEKRWRELTVSELRVWGHAGGAPENPSHLPRMAIGSLDGVRPHPAPSRLSPPLGPFPTVAALCADYDRAMRPVIAAAFPGDRYPGKIEGPHCQPIADPPVAAVAPFTEAAFAIFHDDHEEKAKLVVRTAAGWSRTDVVLWSRYLDDPGCAHGSHEIVEDLRTVRTTTGADVALVRIVRKDVHWMLVDPTFDPISVEETAYACHVDAMGAASCDGPITTGRATPPWPEGLMPSDRKLYDIDLETMPWKTRSKPVLGAAGDLRPGT